MKKNFLFAFFIIVLFTNCNNKRYGVYSKKDYAMGTTLEVMFFYNNKKEAKVILENSFKLANELETKFSSKIENSIISKLNKNKKGKIEDNNVLELLKKSIEYANKTSGAFDPALYNVINLWDIGNKTDIPPGDKIDNELTKSGYKNIKISGNEITLINDASIDLGGVAKGEIVRLIGEYLLNRGITDFLINGGGDIFVNGKYAGKRAWNVAILDPYTKSDYLGVIDIENSSIVTSGNYERFFIKNNKRYHHIIDSSTGYPADSKADSVTIITPNPADGDILATALFVMDVENGIRFINSIPNAEAIFVYKDNGEVKIKVSKGITHSQTKPNFHKDNDKPLYLFNLEK